MTAFNQQPDPDRRPLTSKITPDGQPLALDACERAGGYRAVRRAIGAMTPGDVTQVVKDSGLRGRGGAGFPTGAKWSFVPMGDDAPRPKYLVVNADEMEPGTFKDRLLLEGDPHQLIEGVILAAYAIQADIAYIFIRGEYVLAVQRLATAIAEARGAGLVGRNILGSGYSLEVHLHTSAGRYICGEETALINALEGRRANPRSKPPFPQVCGLRGKPTIVNNVETLCNLPHIVNNGPDWFKGLSLTPNGGTKIYGVSGRVKRPGLWELPMGTPAREIIETHAGGMRDGVKLRAIIPGGASTDFLPESQLDVAMDFDTVAQAGQPHGHGHDDRAGRPHLPRGNGAQPDAVLCTRILRMVHALPRGAAVDREDPGGHGAGRGPAGRPDPAFAPCEGAGHGPDLLRAGAGRHGAAGQRAQAFPRGF